jgi:outer membrane protein insertion porin family
VGKSAANWKKIGSNSTLPVTINSIHFIGGRNTRRSFLDRLFDPLLSANRDRPYTLSEALHEVGGVATKLGRFGMWQIYCRVEAAANGT